MRLVGWLQCSFRGGLQLTTLTWATFEVIGDLLGLKLSAIFDIFSFPGHCMRAPVTLFSSKFAILLASIRMYMYMTDTKVLKAEAVEVLQTLPNVYPPL